MGTKNRAMANSHQATYRKRRLGVLQPLPKPWDFMTSSDVKEIALKAYRVAAWHLKPDLGDPRFTHLELRAMFAQSLSEMFNAAVSAHAVADGFVWPVDADTPDYRNYPRIWDSLCSDIPDSWNPQYPVYQEVAPASVCTTPEALTNADEGNVNERDFTG